MTTKKERASLEQFLVWSIMVDATFASNFGFIVKVLHSKGQTSFT